MEEEEEEDGGGDDTGGGNDTWVLLRTWREVQRWWPFLQRPSHFAGKCPQRRRRPSTVADHEISLGVFIRSSWGLHFWCWFFKTASGSPEKEERRCRLGFCSPEIRGERSSSRGGGSTAHSRRRSRGDGPTAVASGGGDGLSHGGKKQRTRGGRKKKNT